MSITICLSHKEDVDGISSAVLINSAFKKVSTILVDYANLINKLDKLSNELGQVTKGYNRIFICDLGLNKKILINYALFPNGNLKIHSWSSSNISESRSIFYLVISWIKLI